MRKIFSAPLTRLFRAATLLGLCLAVMFGPASVRAGALVFYEATAGPGVVQHLATPASNAFLDIDYSPASAEGGGIFGLSEVAIIATGDLTLSSSGFACQAFGCLYTPSPFTGGGFIMLSGADQLGGEFMASRDLLTLSVSGTRGYVVVVGGGYVDASGPVQIAGSIQSTTPRVVAEVPEPAFGLLLLIGCLLMTALERQRRTPRQHP